MSQVVRFGISLDEELLKRFDESLQSTDYTCRSEAIRDLIRSSLVEKAWSAGTETAGAVTIIYDHHKRNLLNSITDIQHHFHDIIMAAQHIHLDHDNCLEIIAVKGAPPQIQDLVKKIKSLKGVKHCTLSMTSTGRDL